MGAHTDLRDKRVLVTGGTTGIGRETVALLVREAARVLTFGRDQAALEDTLSYAQGAEGFAIDITARDAVERVFQEVDDRLRGVDILVVCAAIGAEPIHEMPDREWRYVIETNLVGSLACARAAILQRQAAEMLR